MKLKRQRRLQNAKRKNLKHNCYRKPRKKRQNVLQRQNVLTECTEECFETDDTTESTEETETTEKEFLSPDEWKERFGEQEGIFVVTEEMIPELSQTTYTVTVTVVVTEWTEWEEFS